MRRLVEDEPRELTGADASVNDADEEDTWSASPVSDEPAMDISPDQVRYLGRQAREDDEEPREITAQPTHDLFSWVD
ncbi:MAG: hypothetical protein ACT4TC_14485 [Myxococcaceae bacterium]